MQIMRDLFQLFLTFFKIGAGTFGGGLAMLPILEREVVEKRRWISSSQLYDYYAIGQSTPGIIAVNVATFTGYVRRGITGAIVATTGIVCPALIIITLIAAFFENFSHIIWIQKALSGINISVSVVITASLIKIAKKSCIDILTVCIAVVSFLLMLVFNVQGVFIVLASSVIGIIAQYKKIKAACPPAESESGNRQEKAEEGGIPPEEDEGAGDSREAEK